MRFKPLSLIVILSILPLLSGWAQVDERIAKGTQDLSKVAQELMPVLDNKTLLDNELAQRQSGRLSCFAQPLDVDINPETMGTWETLPNGMAVWRIRITSQNARSLNLGFPQYFMPESGSLIIYSADYETVMGPFTARDNEDHKQLWSPIIESDDIVVEIQLPESAKEQLLINIGKVNHAFMDFGSAASASGSCNLDVICGEADGWPQVENHRDIIRSVAYMTVNGFGNCTGALINNTAQDETPYFLTAAHCGIGPSDAPGVVAYWNFENQECRQPNSGESGSSGNGPLTTFNTGAIHRASYNPSDMTLLEFDDPVVEEAEGFLAGWNREDVAPMTSIAIHHPNNEEKRISFEDDPSSITFYLDNSSNTNADHVRVEDWDIGTTEGGSSGSPLFDQDERIVGQLHGGGAACGNNEPDWYGRIYTSWEGGGSPQTRLKDWLDPLDLGVAFIDGKDLSYSLTVDVIAQEICAPDEVVYNMVASDNFEGPVSLSLSNVPSGANATLSIETVAPGEGFSLTIGNTMAATPGEYTIVVTGTDGVNTTESNLLLTIFQGIPPSTALMSPPNAATEVSTLPEFMWSGENASTFELQVASDENFDVLAYNNPNIENTSEIVSQYLAPTTTYYWRVRGSSICGMGDWSSVSSFTTANTACGINTSVDVPIAINSDVPNTIQSVLEITESGTIIDIDVVDLVGTHSWLSDLIFTLTSPQGTNVILVAEQCPFVENFNINFDDDAGSSSLPCPYNDGGTYQPQGSLADFNGEEMQGTWTLTVEDTYSADGGQLQNWNLDICATIASEYSVNVTTENANVCTNETVNFGVSLGTAFEGPVTLTATGNPTGSTLTFAENPINPGASTTITLSDLGGASGSYDISVTASDGTNETTNVVTINISSSPSAASLNTPPNNAFDIEISPILTWETVEFANEYLIEIAGDPDFGFILESDITTSTAYTPDPLLYGTTYYWQVTAINDCGEAISSVSSFTTLSELSVVVTPTTQTICAGESFSFDINLGESFNDPTLSASGLPTGSNIEFNPSGTTATLTTGLEDIGDYTITFNADDGVNSNNAQVNVTVEPTPIAATLTSPSNDEIATSITPTLSWESVDGADSYVVIIATDSDFEDVVESSTVTDTSYPVEVALESGVYYFWNVLATGECGSATSETYTFLTEPAPGISEINGQLFNLQPNPTNGQVLLVFEETVISDIALHVFGVDGRLLQTHTIQTATQQYQVDLSDYASGLYYLKLESNKQSLTEKVLLVK